MSSSSNINVSIRIEPTDEYKIFQINYDGEEQLIPPLSMSEHLTQQIQKLDFNQPIADLKEELEPTNCNNSSTSKQNIKSSTINPTWPFESVRKKLLLALTEICVLNDVLCITKAKKYMVFDTVCDEQFDQRPIVELLAKKKALQIASQVLITGVETLKQNLNNKAFSGAASSNQVPLANFDEELLEMRGNWRLKRVSNNIFGDLSYFRPSGHRFSNNTRFEVIKNDPETLSPGDQAIKVKVPADLEGKAYLQISIVEENELSLVDISATTSSHGFEYSKQVRWQEQLDDAHNVLFCKELFNILAKEAVTHQFVIPPTVTGNQIILSLFPNVKLYITLVHHMSKSKGSSSDTLSKLKKSHKPVLEHSLHKMLQDFYALHVKRVQGRDTSKNQGPCAYDKHTIEAASKFDCILEKIVSQSQHLILREQTMNVIDSFASEVKDPQIISHWFCFNSPTNSIVRLDIISPENENLGHARMLIYIGTRNLSVVTRECKNIHLGYEPDELRNLLLWQSCLHQHSASSKLSKLLGWTNISFNYNVGAAKDENIYSAASLVMLSPNCEFVLSIKMGPFLGLSVGVARLTDRPTHQDNMIENSSNVDVENEIHHYSYNDDDFENIKNDNKLENLKELIGPFREIDWNKMHGKDFSAKLELVLAALTEFGG